MAQKHRTSPWVATAAILCGTLAARLWSANEPDGATIEIRNFMFVPASVTVNAGSTVTWINRDEEPHSVVGDTKLFRSGAMDTADRFSFKFDTPGTYHFVCSIHSSMLGTIVVR